MKVVDAVAHILKAEGVEYIFFAYPVNPIIESAAKLDIRTVIVRQERIGLHMADALARLSSGKQIGVFCMQSGPGECLWWRCPSLWRIGTDCGVAHGLSAQSGAGAAQLQFALNFRHVTKLSEQVVTPQGIVESMRRAFTAVRNGRPRPALVEIPADLMNEELPEEINYRPVPSVRYAPDADSVKAAADALLAADRPVIYAGQGIHYAQAWSALKELAELLRSPGHHLVGRQKLLSRKPPALARFGRTTVPKTVHHFCRMPTRSSASVAV